MRSGAILFSLAALFLLDVSLGSTEAQAGETLPSSVCVGPVQRPAGHSTVGNGPSTTHPASRPTRPLDADRVPALEPKLAPGEWEPFVDVEQQIFPSLLLASATLNTSMVRDDEEIDTASHYPEKAKGRGTVAPPIDAIAVVGDDNGTIGITFANVTAGAHLHLTISQNDILEDSTISVTLPFAGQLYRILPKINYRYAVLNRFRQSQPVNIVYKLCVDGSDLGQKIVTARVRPINDCPFAYQNPDDERDYTNISWMFAAYVNEDDPAIGGLLKEAQETGVVDGFDCYQSGDPGKILLQVFAVWSALQKHGIKYSDIGTTAADSDALYTMHVRFIEESLAETHANCVDASVLLASVLRRMGIEPFLVVEPDHMFMGFYLDPERREFACLETTMLGDPDPVRFKPNKYLARDATKDVRKMKGWAGFNDALDSAGRDFQRNKKKFGAPESPRYSIVDIQAARREGIAPIAYLKAD